MASEIRTEQVPDWLTRRAMTHGHVIAIEHESQSLTYQALYDRASGLAKVLSRHGIQAGDRVAVLARDGLTYAITVHSLIQCSAILVPINWRLTSQEITWQCEDADVKLVLFDEASALMIEDIRSESPDMPPGLCVTKLALGAVSPDKGDNGVHPENPRSPERQKGASPMIRLDAPLAIIYTSGTTGRPKGAILTYGNMLWSALASAVHIGLLPGEKWLIPMPLFHVGGLSVITRSVIYGSTAVIHNRFREEDVNRRIDLGDITLVSVVPTMLQRMLELRDGQHFPPALRCVLLGGSAASPALLEFAQQLDVPVAQSYGLTEASSQVTTLLPLEATQKLGSSGKPLPFTDVMISVKGESADVLEIGDILVRGPSIFAGYWRRPDATEEAFQGEWFRTGDLGFVDEEGYLYVVDRRKDLIVSGGENIYPAEIEQTLSTHPLVVESAVIGVPDDHFGQVPVAFVRVKSQGGVGELELKDFLRSRIASYKIPRDIHIVQNPLPRNASGKLLRRNLSAWLQT